MAQISSGSGYKLDRPASPLVARPKGAVGKEEALRMEAEALAKLQREKRPTLPALASSMKALSNAGAASTSRTEKDLIVFPESEAKKKTEKDTFADIDVEKLTKEELEKLLLDDNFGTNKLSRPSSLLGCNLSASYPGGHAFSSAPFIWTPTLSTPSSSGLPTPTHQQASVFPSTPFSKPPCSFQNGFSPAMPPFVPLHTHQTPFLPFPSIQPAGPLVFQQSAISPEMAKLFDKIASTSEYLRNGRSSSMDADSVSAKSLEPVPQLPEPTSMSRFDWLDLDPLSKRRAEVEGAPSAPGGVVMEESSHAGDPWDAVLRDESEGAGRSSPQVQEREPPGAAVNAQPRRASTGMAVTRSYSLNMDETSPQHSQSKQVNKASRNVLANYAALQEMEAQNLEVIAFCEDIAKLKSKFTHDDHSTNPGYVLSPVISQRDVAGDGSSSVKVSIEISESQQPVTFTCDVSSPVELLIMQALCWAHDDLSQVDISSYVLKVCGRDEVLQK